MWIIRLLVVLSISLCLNAAGHPAKNKLHDKLKYLEKTIPKVTPAKLMKWIQYEKDFILLDVRDPDELGSGYIDATEYMKISRGKLEFAAIQNNGIPQDRLIVVYCTVGSRGLLATELLKNYGYKKVYNLLGGLNAWVDAGYPVETDLGTFRKIPDSELD